MPPPELETIWEGVRAELRRSTTDLTFHLWLDPLKPACRDGDALYVRAPGHIRTLVEERHLPRLRAAAERALGRRVTVRVVDEDWSPPSAGNGGGAPSEAGGARPSSQPLNPKYTFEQFVIGDGNRLAHAAALAVAEQPGQAYNPLFLYGEPGLGKTHLLHAIGNYVQRYGGGLVVRYATSDEFTSAFVHAAREGGMDGFKAAFRHADVLLIDDVQFLGSRLKTREEFFHTFNALYEGGCQIVVSSDRPPRDAGAFERRLAERFASGLVAELEPPAREVRLAILRKRAALDDLPAIPDQVLDEVASRVTSSVRSLEGALIRLVAYASLEGEQPTPELARHVLARLYEGDRTPQCTIADVQQVTAEAFSVSPEALTAHDRRPAVTFARQVAMYLARELTDESLPSIGMRFGGRNHTTVLHAHRKIEREITKEPKAAGTIDDLRRRLLADRSE